MRERDDGGETRHVVAAATVGGYRELLDPLEGIGGSVAGGERSGCGSLDAEDGC